MKIPHFDTPERDCRMTYKGIDYVGTRSVDNRGTHCAPWRLDVNLELSQKSHQSSSAIHNQYERFVQESNNYCRVVPGMDWDSPKCLIYEGDMNYRYSSCDIPYCG